MLTASKPFGGEDISEMLAAVIKSEPDWDALPTETPAVLGSFLRGCLKKDPRERVRDIGDVRLAVQGLFETPHDAEAVRVATRPTAVWQRPAPAAVLALSVFALGGLAVWMTTPTDRPEAPPVVRFQAPLPPDTLLGVVLNHRLAVSPDGTRVAYAAQDQLYVRRMDEPMFTPIAGTERALEPVFSPDGQSIAFWLDAQLKRVSLLGGAPVPIADMVPYFGASWEADDMILLSIPGVGIARVPAAGGDPEVLIPATGDVSQGVLASTFFLRPQILPGGDWILFSLFPSGQVVMQSLVTNEQQLLVERGGDAVYVDTGHLVYADGGVLFARLFDVGTGAVGAEAVRLLEGVLQNLNGVAQFDVSDDGTLVSVPGSGAGLANRLVWVDRDGLEEPLDVPPGDYSTPRVSPDGSAIAFDRAADIWTLDLARGAETRVTNDLAASVAPLWTPDGSRLVYGTFGTGDDEGLFWKSADGTGDAELLVSIPDAVIVAPSAWSADGNSLVFWGVPNGVNPDVGLFSMNGDDTSVSFLLDSESQEAAPTVSPDGRWIAYDSNESGTPEIYVQRFPELGQRMTVSIDGGTQALWSRDGTEIFYRGPRGMMAVPVSLEPTFSLGAPVALFEDRYAFLLVRRTYDVAPDGRFLMVKERERDNDAAPYIDVVLNWVQELTERLPRP